ncbi:deoxyuridine 5'-triphosphate nucleotidohydrolase-like [Salvia miltiorrhiza]|uniref:deoxyuridine 5'-triphosphate nucleotidohydrolase-like n=1 Tax=Salvia miltiorrhiza TaxID=226208 RepID=UPI0025AD6F73|nr:deoxyuridine 5'-triphosphate nucleotidohydrolase-like [Salvia miltiorrhiza]
MAGIISPIFQLPRIAPPFKSHAALTPTFICKFSLLPNRKISSNSIEMAQAAENPNYTPEIQEPSPKIQKIHDHNGVSDTKPTAIVPFLRVKRLSEKAVLPSRASPLSAGYDLSSAVDTKVQARGKALVPTDLSVAVPEGTYGRIAPRSGLAWKHSIDVGAGVVDADYRGPVGVILFNHSDVDFEVKAGDRIAQLIIQKIVTPEVAEVDDLDSTARGSGGFGSTGV